MRLILASKSLRRIEMLKALGLAFDIISPDIDESQLPGESPEEHVTRLAREKARAVAGRTDAGPCVILAADTVVVLNERIFGKPVDGRDASRMLGELSGRSHRVLSGYALLSLPQNEMLSGCEATTVTFKPISPREIEVYVATGEPLDKAGAYAIQGGAAAFTDKIEGSFHNVVGLPLERLRPLLAKILSNPSLNH